MHTLHQSLFKYMFASLARIRFLRVCTPAWEQDCRVVKDYGKHLQHDGSLLSDDFHHHFVTHIMLHVLHNVCSSAQVSQLKRSLADPEAFLPCFHVGSRDLIQPIICIDQLLHVAALAQNGTDKLLPFL